MGIITRHANAPFANGEVLSGSDLESDFATAYAAINGNLTSANLADSAVTTAKIAATAVTQAKMTSGAASASEAQIDVTVNGFTILSASWTDIGTAVTHTVGNPARHVILIASWNWVVSSSTTSILIRMLKNGAELNSPGVSDQEDHLLAGLYNIEKTRMFIDTAPAAGTTITYQLQMKGVSAATSIARNLALVAFEPRS